MRHPGRRSAGTTAQRIRGVAIACALCLLLVPAGAVTAGSDVKVNQDPSPVYLQNEVSLVVNPANSSNLIAAYNDDPDKSGGFSTGPGIGLSSSTNGGSTWSTTQSASVWGSDFDPTVTADASGNVYEGHISSTGSYPTANTGVFVSRSSDSGLNWTQPATVEAFMGFGVLPVPFEDKCYAAADTYAGSPQRGRVHIVWQRDATDWLHSEIYAASTTDQATSFSTPVKVNDSPPLSSLSNAPVPAVTRDGTLCVAWIETNQPHQFQTAAYIMFDKSTDGGATFSTDVTVAAFTKVAKYPDTPVYASFRANSFPAMAADPTDGRRIYVVYTGDPDEPGGPDNGNVYFTRSTDGGATWSTPAKLSDDLGISGQFSPWITVTPTGDIYAAWYDRRADPLDLDLNVYYTRSTDGGGTFSANQRVNDATIALTPDTTVSANWLGEYLGLASDSSYVHFAWTGISGIDKDIYYDKLALGTPTDTSPPMNPALASPSHTPGAWSNDNTVDATWSGASDDSGIIDGYSIDWTPSATTPIDTIADVDDTVNATTSPPLADGSWYFHLRTEDGAGNWSSDVTMGPFRLDTTAPGRPTGLAASAGDGQATLSWTNPAEPNLDRTRVLRSASAFATAPGEPGQFQAYEGTATTRSDTGLANGTLYYYSAFSRDLAGNWSTQPATATARPRFQTWLTLAAQPTLVSYNQTANLTAALTIADGTALGPPDVTLWRRPAGSATWTRDTTAVYDPSVDVYTATITCTANSYLQMRFPGDTTYAATSSPEVGVKAQAYLSRPVVTPNPARAVRLFAVYGYLKPRHSGSQRLDFYRRGRTGWRRVAIRYARNSDRYGYTRYRLTTKFLARGSYYVKAYHADTSHSATASPRRYFAVR